MTLLFLDDRRGDDDRTNHEERGDLESRREAGTPLRVLIFGLNYWPEETGIAPYTTGLAEYLASRGAAVTVVAGMPYYPEWRVADAYGRRSRLEETRHGVRIVRYRQFVSRKQSAVHRALLEGSALLSSLRSVRLPRPDVILGVVPGLASGVLAALAARRYGVPYGLLFQDLISRGAEQSGIAGGGRVARSVAAIEGWSARGAAGVGVVAESFRDYLEGLGVLAEAIAYLPNWSHIEAPRLPRDEVRAQLGWPSHVTVALHAGNMGLKQGLTQVIDAARRAASRDDSLRFVLMGDGNQRATLEALGAGLPNVVFLDAQPSDRFADVLRAADVLLVTQRASVADMSLPSKLTSYFVAGRPVVAAVSAESATARHVIESGAGLVVPAEAPTALLEAIDRLAEDMALREQLAGAGPRFAAEHLVAADSLERCARFVAGLRTPRSVGDVAAWAGVL